MANRDDSARGRHEDEVKSLTAQISFLDEEIAVLAEPLRSYITGGWTTVIGHRLTIGLVWIVITIVGIVIAPSVSSRLSGGNHQKVLLAITRCRTAALGGHRDRCTGCGLTTRISYNSCRNRHCPRCQGNARLRWLKAAWK